MSGDDEGSPFAIFFIVILFAMAVGVGAEIGKFCAKPARRRKKERHYVKSLAATYNLPVDHVERAREVFGLFPVLETRQLLQAAQEDNMTTLQWHQVFGEFIERTVHKKATVAAKSEALLV